MDMRETEGNAESENTMIGVMTKSIIRMIEWDDRSYFSFSPVYRRMYWVVNKVMIKKGFGDFYGVNGVLMWVF